MSVVARLVNRPWIVFLLIFIAHGVATKFRPVMAADTGLYVSLADRLVGRIGPSAFSPDILLTGKVFRLAFAAVLAAIRAVGGEHWAQILYVLNLACDAAIGTLLVQLVLAATSSLRTAWFALILFGCAFESFMWIRYVLSDGTFAFLAFIPFFLVARGAIQNSMSRKSMALLILSVLAAFFYRPSALFLPLIVIVGAVMARPMGDELRRAIVARGIVATAVLSLAVIFTNAWIVQAPSRWPFGIFQRPIRSVATGFHNGEVVHDRPETARTRPARYGDYVVITFDKYIRYFQFTAQAYSRGHKLMNVVYFVPLYGFAICGMVLARRQAYPQLILLAALWIHVFALLHALTIVDFDWRYRLPVMPQLIFLAAFGFDSLFRRHEVEAVLT